MSENDLYYLQAIHRRMIALRSNLTPWMMLSLGGEAFNDEIDWLDCFIDKIQRRLEK